MEKTNLLALVVTLTVGIILAGSLLMPVLADTTETEKTFTNTGYFRMATLEDDDSVILEWDSTDPTKIKSGDDSIEIGSSVGSYQSRSVAFAENYLVRYLNTGSGYGLQVWTSSYVIGADSDTEQVVTITLGNGSLKWETTASQTATTRSYTGDMHYINSNGSDIMKKSTDEAYLLHTSSIIYAGGISTIVSPSTFSGLYLEGTVDDITVTPMNNDVTVGDVAVDYSEVSGYLDLVKFKNITFTTTYEGNVVNQTYNYVVVPYQVTAKLSQHLDAGEIALLNTLPILVIIGLVMAGVGAIFISRNRD